MKVAVDRQDGDDPFLVLDRAAGNVDDEFGVIGALQPQ